VVITGATSGIGARVAQDFSAAGHPLLLLGRRQERMEQLGLPNALCEKVDVCDAGAVRAAVDKAEAKFGPVGCLVNNAGVMLLGSVASQDPSEWTQMLQVNIGGVLNGISAVLKGMQERKAGHLINISSIAGIKLFPNHAVYCATKFAVHALTEGLRQECAGLGVRVTVISPGAVETELLSHTTDQSIKDGYGKWKESMTEGVLQAEDVSQAVLFAYNMPKRCCVRDIQLAPTNQEP